MTAVGAYVAAIIFAVGAAIVAALVAWNEIRWRREFRKAPPAALQVQGIGYIALLAALSVVFTVAGGAR